MSVMSSFNKKYAQLLEHNQHEGETWCYWLQMDGNEVAIDTLVDLIEEEELEDEYEFTGIIAYDFEVEVLLRLGNFGYGYMSQHHKFEGKLEFPNGFQVNDIYKGRIEDFFKE